MVVQKVLEIRIKRAIRQRACQQCGNPPCSSSDNLICSVNPPTFPSLERVKLRLQPSIFQSSNPPIFHSSNLSILQSSIHLHIPSSNLPSSNDCHHPSYNPPVLQYWIQPSLGAAGLLQKAAQAGSGRLRLAASNHPVLQSSNTPVLQY